LTSDIQLSQEAMRRLPFGRNLSLNAYLDQLLALDSLNYINDKRNFLKSHNEFRLNPEEDHLSHFNSLHASIDSHSRTL